MISISMEFKNIQQLIDSKFKFQIKNEFANGGYDFLLASRGSKSYSETVDLVIVFDEQFELRELDDDNRFNWEYWRKIKVLLRYNETLVDSEEILQLDFFGVGYIRKDFGEYTYEIIDPNKFHFKKLYELKQVYINTLELKSLQDYKSSYIDSSSLSTLIHVCRGINSIKKFNDSEVGLDIIYTNKDLLILISELFLLRPYIYDITKNKISHEVGDVYTYFPTFYDKQYFLCASHIIQIFYNYWDKIGDLISFYFNTGLQEDKIYFPSVIDKFPKEFKNTNFEWLQRFKDDKFVEINKMRKRIVHYVGLEGDNLTRYIENNSNKLEIERIHLEKISLPDFFIEHFKLTIIGFEETLKLIDSKK